MSGMSGSRRKGLSEAAWPGTGRLELALQVCVSCSLMLGRKPRPAPRLQLFPSCRQCPLSQGANGGIHPGVDHPSVKQKDLCKGDQPVLFFILAVRKFQVEVSCLVPVILLFWVIFGHWDHLPPFSKVSWLSFFCLP